MLGGHKDCYSSNYEASSTLQHHLFLLKEAVNVTSHLLLHKAGVSIALVIFSPPIICLFRAVRFSDKLKLRQTTLSHSRLAYSRVCSSTWSPWHPTRAVYYKRQFIYPKMAYASLEMLWVWRSHSKSSVQLPRLSYCDVPWLPSFSARTESPGS